MYFPKNYPSSRKHCSTTVVVVVVEVVVDLFMNITFKYTHTEKAENDVTKYSNVE